MNTLRRSIPALALAAGAILAPPAFADHHLMQIEQVIGGVNGDVTAQAVQFRMRSSFQNIMANGRLRAWDATGNNPVMVIDFISNVPNHGAGVRVLLLSAGMVAHLDGTSNANYTMTNPIPASYLAAGSLTFEDNFGTIWWRVSWGGASYTGSGSVNPTNDGQGDATFNPPFNPALPSTTTQSLITTLGATAGGNSTLADYVLSAGSAVLTNNAGVARTVTGITGVENPVVRGGVSLGAPAPNPSTGSLSYAISLERDTRVRVEVYTAGGRRVGNLMDAELPAGPHRFTWDGREGGGSSVPSGVYYLRVTAGDVRLARTFAIVR